MNNYIEQLQQIKNNMKQPVTRNRWTDADVLALLKTGEAIGHPRHSCNVMLSLLRTQQKYYNKFYSVIKKYETETGNKFDMVKGVRCSDFTKEQIEKIKQHIVPLGCGKQVCQNWLSRNGYLADGTRTHWRYETEYSVKLEEKTKEAIPSFAETVEKHETTTDDLSLNLMAIKALMNTGMTYSQIAKITGKEENLVIALMKVAEAF